jgi:hypothetical protein
VKRNGKNFETKVNLLCQSQSIERHAAEKIIECFICRSSPLTIPQLIDQQTSVVLRKDFQIKIDDSGGFPEP